MTAGLYIHIPFCRQACHYCDFHFSTSAKHKEALLVALMQEMEMQKIHWQHLVFDTLYFGGGTPSLLTDAELTKLMDAARVHYRFTENPEVTLEANPDDITGLERLCNLKEVGINRLSIGIQSFRESDLRLMNRAHNSQQALTCLQNAKKYFDNISVDLIYGIPGMDLQDWKKNLEIFKSFELPHLSCYALTVEPRTALPELIKKGVIPPVEEEDAQIHFEYLLDFADTHNYLHYEISNFGKEGYFSRNNTAYWSGKPYLGIGPSAHSYNLRQRFWNVSNNALYVKNITKGTIPAESETLSVFDRYNETIMTGLRTQWGISLSQIEQKFGLHFKDFLAEQATALVLEGWLLWEDEVLKTSRKGKFMADGLAAQLFMLAPDNYLFDY